MEAGAEQLPIDQTKAFTGALFLLLRGPAIELATYTSHFDSLSSHHILYSSLLETCFTSREPVDEMGVLKLLARHMTASATNLRDKGFVLLGLVTEDKENGIKVDYYLDVTEVHLNAATSIIERSKFLDIVSVPLSAHSHLVLPSWVPDWSTNLFPPFTL
jgi:hypothetical protein